MASFLRFGRRRGFRQFAGNPRQTLVNVFEQGTFSQLSGGIARDGIASISNFDSTQKREVLFEYYGAGSGKGILYEGIKTNLLAADPLDIEFVGAWAVNNSSGQFSFSGAHSTITSPDGQLNAYIVNYGASQGDEVRDTGATITASADYTASIWARTVTGSENFRLTIRWNTAQRSNDFTATEAWQRFTFSGTTPGGAESIRFFGITNGSDAQARTLLFFAPQLEDGLFATSNILTASATRDVDFHRVFATDVPSRISTGRWKIELVPLFSSNELIQSNGINTIMVRPGTNDVFRWLVTGGNLVIQLRNAGGSVLNSNPVTFSRHQKITAIVDQRGFLEIQGATSGNGRVIGASIGWVDETAKDIGATNKLLPGYTIISNIKAG